MSDFGHCKIPSGLEDVDELSKEIIEESGGNPDQYVSAAQALFQRKLDEKAEAKRRTYLNLKALIRTVEAAESNNPDNLADGLHTDLMGSNVAREGARNNVAARQEALARYYRSSAMAEIQDTGFETEFKRGDYDKEIAEVMDKMGKEQDIGDYPEGAIEIAKVMKKWFEIMRQDTNAAGGYVKKDPSYMGAQTHDMYHLRSASKRVGGEHTTNADKNFKAWNDFIIGKLDPKTFEGVEDIGKFMRSAFDAMASGTHMRHTETPLSDMGLPPKGSSSLAGRLSQGRVLKFKDGASWFEYNSVFGKGNLREGFISKLDVTANSVPIMRAYGTNPAQTMGKAMMILQKKAAKGGHEAREKFSKQRQKLHRAMSVVDGSASVVENHKVAVASQTIRDIKTMSSLGSSLFTSLSDIAVAASDLGGYQGRGMIAAYGNILGGFKGKATPEQKRIANALGQANTSLISQIRDKHSVRDNIQTQTSSMVGSFFKYNLQNAWTDKIRTSMSLAMSNYMAGDVGKSFGKLSNDTKRIFKMYSIDNKIWDMMRRVDLDEADGSAYFTPEMARKIPDHSIAKYIRETQGVDAKPNDISDFRREIEERFLNYFIDRVQYGILEPDARVKAITKMGGRPGTFMGEAGMFVAQFKSHSMSMLIRPWSRILWGYSDENRSFGQAIKHAAKNENGELQDLAHLMVATTMFGYMSFALKDFVLGKTPRDPSDPSTWMAAFVQGGGGAIYADFLLNEYNRDSGDVLRSLSGPVISDAGNVYDIFKTLMSDSETANQRAASKAIRTVYSNIPYSNHFAVKGVVDYLFIREWQEMVNPGYKERVEGYLNEGGQEYIDFSSMLGN